MPGIRDTAYPQLKSTPFAKELEEVYTPHFVELVWAEKRTRERTPRVGLLVLLKTGYGNDSVQNRPFDFERASRGLEASWRSRRPGVRDFRLRNTFAVAFLDFCGSRAGRGWRRVGKTRTQTGTTGIR
jgi:hypothetical protein